MKRDKMDESTTLQKENKRSPEGMAIVLKNLTKKYEDVTAVDKLNLEVESGELFGLLGPNGAGKTTTINILCGLLTPTSGSAYVGGYEVQREAKRIKELIGVAPQETAVFPSLTGRENVELFGDLHLVPKEKLRENVDVLLRKVGMVEDAKKRVAKYSGGMMRRISLVMALVNDPQIAFLDEPTVGMDPQARHAVWDFIKELNKKGKTVILTTQYMEEAEELCHRVAVIDHGKLIALGSPRELRHKYGAKNLEDVFIQLTGRKIREGI